MPISTSVPIKQIDKAAFHRIDEMVTESALEIHHEFGRFLDLKLYQSALAQRIQQAGYSVAREVKVMASLGDYQKEFVIDFIIDGCVIVETKTVTKLTSLHRAQLMNDLFLTNASHGTLLNFRTESVEHDLVSSALTEAARKNIPCTAIDWKILSTECQTFHDALCRILCDWGSRLDVSVYRDAVIHLLGGEEKVAREVPVNAHHGPLGLQKMHLLTDEIAFSITASQVPLKRLVEHQQRMLQHTPLRAIQLVNLNRQHVSLHTILKH